MAPTLQVKEKDKMNTRTRKCQLPDCDYKAGNIGKLKDDNLEDLEALKEHKKAVHELPAVAAASGLEKMEDYGDVWRATVPDQVDWYIKGEGH